MFFRHLKNLIVEFAGFAREHKAWWIIPLMLCLALIALLVASAQGAAPFIYTLF